jgi:hypothetical protein
MSSTQAPSCPHLSHRSGPKARPHAGQRLGTGFVLDLVLEGELEPCTLLQASTLATSVAGRNGPNEMNSSHGKILDECH